MQLDPRPTAIFAVNHNTAIGALSAVGMAGLSVPEDVLLVGYNDIPIAGLRVPFDQIAAALDVLAAEPGSPRDHIRVANRTLIPRRSGTRPRGRVEGFLP